MIEWVSDRTNYPIIAVKQSDRADRLFFQHWAIENNDNVPNNIQNWPKLTKNVAQKAK